MALPALEDQVIDLRETLNEFIRKTEIGHAELVQAQRETKRELNQLSYEMRLFIDEMRSFKDETVEDRKRMNKQWGELANRLGTIVEDIVAPNIEGIARRYFGCTELDSLMVRYRKRNPKNISQRREFDVIAVWDDSVLLNETKATVRMEYIAEFAAFLASEAFFDFFPEYRGKTFIPVFSSLYLSEEMVRALSDAGIYAMAMSDDSMDLLNFDQVKQA